MSYLKVNIHYFTALTGVIVMLLEPRGVAGLVWYPVVHDEPHTLSERTEEQDRDAKRGTEFA
jgi:hypothetical protein